MIRRKNKSGYISIFTKSVTAFLCLVLLPFMLVSFSVLQKNLVTVRETTISNANQISKRICDDIEILMEDVNQSSQSFYEYQFGDYGYFYDIMDNPQLSDILKENLIEDVLKNILYSNSAILHVLFIGTEGQQFSSTRAPEKIVNEVVMREWSERNFVDEKNRVSIISTHSSDYYRNSKVNTVTFSRNIMNTRNLQSANTDILGTLYIDISMESFRTIIEQLEITNSNEIMLMDMENKSLVYSNYDSEKASADIRKIKESKDGPEEKIRIKTSKEYYIGNSVSGTKWIVYLKLPFTDFEKTYNYLLRSVISLLTVSIGLLILLYYYNSKTISKPIKILTRGMDQIKSGDLDTRVDITSHDELGILADGLNSMAEQLQKHIERSYVSEIKQKDAQFKALTTQIQPHYLYNTLDAIRMSAIMNDDGDTALMLESLSSQMRYLIGNNKNLVTLKEELDSIKNYFIIAKLRYDNQVNLEITAEDDVLSCMTPRLTLQPLIENAVKYGIVPKGKGTIAVYAKRIENEIEMTVIDDGAGMDEAMLEYVKEILSGARVQKETEEKKFSIGLRNVEERIKLQFGESYGLDISSTTGLGTLVRCRLPMMREGERENDVFSGDC